MTDLKDIGERLQVRRESAALAARQDFRALFGHDPGDDVAVVGMPMAVLFVARMVLAQLKWGGVR